MSKISKELTISQLESWGIKNVIWDDEDRMWRVERLWWPGGRIKRIEENKVLNILTEKDAVCKHKYSSDKTYKIFSFSIGVKQVSVPVARLVLAWFEGCVPEGYDAEHKDNNPFNNSYDNLYIISHADNLRKRFSDNNCACFNQYKNKENVYEK